MNRCTTKRHAFGITLIELLVTLAIIAIIAGLVYPSYSQKLRAARRNDATTSLLRIQLAQENFRAMHTDYAEDIESLGWPAPAKSDQGYYLLDLLPDIPDSSGFIARARPLPDTDQARDMCQVLVIDKDGPNLDLSSAPDCWKR